MDKDLVKTLLAVELPKIVRRELERMIEAQKDAPGEVAEEFAAPQQGRSFAKRGG